MSMLRQQNLPVIILITITSISTLTEQQQNSCDHQTFPFTVTLNLIKTSTSFCSGTLLAPKWVLTAAHCTQMFGPKHIFVKKPQTREQRCQEIYPHPSFDEKSTANDISLILLRGNLGSSNYAILPALGFTQENCLRLDALGWEHNHWIKKDVSDMNLFCVMGTFRLDSRSTPCRATIPVPYLNPDKVICASTDLNGLHPCQGDSGGPLVCKSAVVVGVISFGYGCEMLYTPTIYTRVEKYSRFLSDMLVKHGSELKEMSIANGSSVYYVSGNGNKWRENYSFLVFLLFVSKLVSSIRVIEML